MAVALVAVARGGGDIRWQGVVARGGGTGRWHSLWAVALSVVALGVVVRGGGAGGNGTGQWHGAVARGSGTGQWHGAVALGTVWWAVACGGGGGTRGGVTRGTVAPGGAPRCGAVVRGISTFNGFQQVSIETSEYLLHCLRRLHHHDGHQAIPIACTEEKLRFFVTPAFCS